MTTKLIDEQIAAFNSDKVNVQECRGAEVKLDTINALETLVGGLKDSTINHATVEVKFATESRMSVFKSEIHGDDPSKEATALSINFDTEDAVEMFKTFLDGGI